MPNKPICRADQPPSCRDDDPTLTDRLLCTALLLMLPACYFAPAIWHVAVDFVTRHF